MSQAFYETEGTAYLLSAPCMLGNGTYSLSILVVLTGSKRPFIEDHLAWHAPVPLEPVPVLLDTPLRGRFPITPRCALIDTAAAQWRAELSLGGGLEAGLPPGSAVGRREAHRRDTYRLFHKAAYSSEKSRQVRMRSGTEGAMGHGVCSRRQKKVAQSLLLLTVVCGLLYGGLISYEMHKQLKRTEAMALKYQQHQESLSAQLQVVYEHRSRLEKSLQKERLEHKKAKEDYLVYKLEAQQILNKEKQDAHNRFHSLNVQHQMLKVSHRKLEKNTHIIVEYRCNGTSSIQNQHDDLKKQFYELQDQHQAQNDNHGKTLEEHRKRYDDLQQNKELEISKLKENMYNLREENKQLRKAHQDVHMQLQDVRQQHKNLKSAHDQLAVALEDHKSALAAAQAEVTQLKKLKVSDRDVAGAEADQQGVTGVREQVELKVTAGMSTGQVEPNKEGEGEQAVSVRQWQQQEEKEEERQHVEEDQHAQQLPQARSAYEEQLEQQRLAAQREEESRQLQRHQEALHEQQLREQEERQQQQQELQDREELQQREADLREQRLRDEQLRQKNRYEHVNADIGEGHEDPQAEGDDDSPPPTLSSSLGGVFVNQTPLLSQPLVEDELNPQDDPNNQGEDELEDAEEQQEERPLDHHGGENPGRPPAEEQLVMAGNPDQQEDTLDEQYQEEPEEEVREDLAAGQKQEGEEDEDTYNEENVSDNVRQDGGSDTDNRRAAKEAEANEEENYEEEEGELEEEEGGAKDSQNNRRAEM
ncbi:Golgi integral membrane protein 4 isoform X1 [Arapaima gigas]